VVAGACWYGCGNVESSAACAIWHAETVRAEVMMRRRNFKRDILITRRLDDMPRARTRSFDVRYRSLQSAFLVEGCAALPSRGVGKARSTLKPGGVRLARLRDVRARIPMRASTHTRNGDSQPDTKLGNLRDTGLAQRPDRRQCRPYGYLLGITRPKVGRGIRRRGLTSGSC
jgi:hypothetical protein